MDTKDIKLAIVGSRSFDNYELIVETLKGFKFTEIISGGAKGADSLAERYAKEFNIPITIFPANWKLYKKRAGMIRNKDIIENSHKVIAFWDGESKGTKNSIELAHKTKKPIKVVKYESNKS